MRRAVLISLILAGALLGCCRTDTVPMPGRMNSEGLLLKTQEVQLGGGYILQHQQILKSDLWNDFYPFNVAGSKPVQEIVNRLYVIDMMKKQLVDWADISETSYRCPQISRDGERIVFNRPEVSPARDGEYPAANLRDIRTSNVALYSKEVGKVILLDNFNGVYAASHSNLWRKQCDWAAFTAYCHMEGGDVWGLVVVGYGGEVQFSPLTMNELTGLEFIAWSPDGSKIAALRPAKPQSRGEMGGELVEFDLAKKALRTVGTISPDLAANHLNELQEIIDWHGNVLSLSPP